MIDSNYLQGMIAFDSHDYKKAQALFLAAIQNNPGNPENHYYLGKSYFFCGKKHEAIAPLKRFIVLRQENKAHVENVAYAFDLLGQCYAAENNVKNALISYETATTIHPRCASAWHNKALLYMQSAQNNLAQNLETSFELLNGANTFLKNALEICSTHPSFLQTVANWYEKYIEALEQLTTEDQEAVEENISNNYRLAIEYYGKALTACKVDDLGLQNIIKENFAECLAQYGHHLYRGGNYGEAQLRYQEAIEYDGNHLNAINQLGMSLFKQDRIADARKQFLHYISKASEPQDLADAWLNTACTYRLDKAWEDAEQALDKAKSFAPDDQAIADEEAELIAAKLRALYVISPQVLLNRISRASQSEHHEVEEKIYAPG